MAAAAGASARPLPAPARHDGERQPGGAPQRRPVHGPVAAPRPRPRPRRRLQPLPTRLVVFGVLLALLAVGRVTLSFAVVQKNLQTDTVSRQFHVVEAQNQQLAETAATLSSALAVRNAAVIKYHLIVAPDVQFITVHPGHSGTRARR
jgi:cell division protein FtsB